MLKEDRRFAQATLIVDLLVAQSLMMLYVSKNPSIAKTFWDWAIIELVGVLGIMFFAYVPVALICYGIAELFFPEKREMTNR